MSHRKIVFKTVGCRANQADTATLRKAVLSTGAKITDISDGVDVVVINTCCVTKEAERDCRKAARRALREAPNAKVVFTGCAVSAIENFGKDIDDRIVFLGGGDESISDLAARLKDMVETSTVETPIVNQLQYFAGRTRALLKIQNGCTHYCSYCIVPSARGPEKSMPITEIFERVDEIAAEGFMELVLTGVQIGAWGKDLPGRPRLSELITGIADHMSPGRVRLSSIEPWSVNDDLIEVIAGHDRVCPHLHVPLQSGDDNVLKAMRRGYSANEFATIARKAVERSKDLSFGTDVICGFPGEDEAAFANTTALLRDLPLAYLHAFPYSEREGTRAAAMLPKSDRAVAKDRVKTVRTLGIEADARFKRSQMGKVRETIVESTNGEHAHGLTDNFLQVKTSGAPGQLINVRLEPCNDEDKILGKRVSI